MDFSFPLMRVAVTFIFASPVMGFLSASGVFLVDEAGVIFLPKQVKAGD